MFNIKPIEQNIGKYSKQQLQRKIQVVGLKSKDLTEQIQNLFKQIHDLQIKNTILQYNLHSTTRDRVQDLDKITFDSSFKEHKNMEKEVNNYVNNEIIQNNYRLIENNNSRGKESVKGFESCISQEIMKAEEIIVSLKEEYDRQESKKQGLLNQIESNQKQLFTLLNFYQNIESDIDKLQDEKNRKYKQNNITILEINEIREDSQQRHARDNYKFQKSKQSIRDIQNDLTKVENQLRYVNGQNQKLDIIRVEVDRRGA